MNQSKSNFYLKSRGKNKLIQISRIKKNRIYINDL